MGSRSLSGARATNRIGNIKHNQHESKSIGAKRERLTTELSAFRVRSPAVRVFGPILNANGSAFHKSAMVACFDRRRAERCRTLLGTGSSSSPN